MIAQSARVDFHIPFRNPFAIKRMRANARAKRKACVAGTVPPPSVIRLRMTGARVKAMSMRTTAITRGVKRRLRYSKRPAAAIPARRSPPTISDALIAPNPASRLARTPIRSTVAGPITRGSLWPRYNCTSSTRAVRKKSFWR